METSLPAGLKTTWSDQSVSTLPVLRPYRMS
jgi:hypothetical protein